MPKVKGKHRKDEYYKLAREIGFRSRASYKLLNLDAKHKFLHNPKAVLDLCAAPGGWMQVAVKKIPVGNLVLGVDLVPISPVRGCVTIQQDITRTVECKSKIRQVMKKYGVQNFDLVLHDGSPNIGGAWSKEAMCQNTLVIDSLKIATELLAPNGNFITKVFRSRDYASVLFCLKKLFGKVEVFKPLASRKTSAEIYLLGLGYKADKIDKKLLDFRHLFKETSEPNKRKVVDVLGGSKQKRNREGYEDGDTILRKVASASDFIWSDNHLEILSTVSCISFDDEASLPLKEHDFTTEEIKILCDDLRVLGKNDFNHIIKWRMCMKKALAPETIKEPNVTKKVEENEEDTLLNELEELSNKVELKKKQAKKLLAKRRSKDKMRKANGSKTDALEDGYVGNELFSLSVIKGKKDLMAVDTIEDDYHENIDDEIENKDNDDVSIDSDEKSHERYFEHMEETFDEAYDRYIAMKEGSSRQRKRARQAYADNLEEEDTKLDYDSDMNLDKDEANPLVVSLDDEKPETKEEISNKWFSQDIFSQAMEVEEDLKIDHKPEKSEQSLPKSSKKETAFDIFSAIAIDSDSDSFSDDDDTKANVLACAKKMLKKKHREEMLDDAYNKYMFNDESLLPKWFLDDEKKHREAMKPITKEEVNAMKARFKEINARPAKKVVEAKARKKRAAMKRLEKVKKKANTISDTTDISNRSKDKMIEKLYKKALEARKVKRELVVSMKGVAVKVGKGQKRVDRRMKSDARKCGRGKPSNKKSGTSKSGKKVKFF